MPTGQCNCGSVKVDIPDMPDSSVLCHCLSCRASGGTAFSTNLVVKKEDLTIYGEEHTKVYRDHKTDSGNVAARRFCANCGSPIVTVIEGHEEVQYLKAALFGPGIPKPAAELFYKKRGESWEKEHDGADIQ